MRKIVIVLGLALWPLSLLLANRINSFQYFIPAFLILISYLVFIHFPKYYIFPLLLIPLFEPKLSLISISVASFEFFNHRTRLNFLILIFSILFLIFSWKAFIGQTIFNTDYESEQKILANVNLYPSILEARIFQNKPRIYIDKFNYNFFALIDPNNYFFGFHPREISIDNQNLKKFPIFGVIFILLGLYCLNKHKDKKFILVVLFGCLLNLSILSIFDRNDFVLWVPLSLIFIFGTGLFSKYHRLQNGLFLASIVFTLAQIAQIFVSFYK